jgi:hypothetical protein
LEARVVDEEWRAARYLQRRDREILRTLVRLRFLTTKQITTTWFGAAQVSRRRLQILSSRDLIRPHRRGVPEALRYSAWRLTPLGVRTVRTMFPDEPIPDGLEEKLAQAKITDLFHREALAAVYLEFLGGVEEPCAEPDRRQTEYRASRMRARANHVGWQPDGDVVLRHSTVAGELRLVPDAILVSPRRRVRVFVEVDRSTKDLGRIRENLLTYRRIVRESYANAYRDQFQPKLLYVVRSKARRANILTLGRELGLAPLDLAVEVAGETTRWLEEVLVDRGAEEVPCPTEPDQPARRPTVRELRDQLLAAQVGIDTLTDELTRVRGPAPPAVADDTTELRAAASEVYGALRTMRQHGTELSPDAMAALQRLHRALNHGHK